MLIGSEGKDAEARVSRGRRSGLLLVLGAGLLALLGAAAGALYIWGAPDPIRLGPYVAAGPQCRVIYVLTSRTATLGPVSAFSLRNRSQVLFGQGAVRTRGMEWSLPSSQPVSLAPSGGMWALRGTGHRTVLAGRTAWTWGGFTIIGP
jgi:hypothetical protein